MKLTIVEELDYYHVLDFFAGKARIARIAKSCGLAAAALDKDYCDGDNRKKTNSMDVNTNAGFLLLVCPSLGLESTSGLNLKNGKTNPPFSSQDWGVGFGHFSRPQPPHPPPPDPPLPSRWSSCFVPDP